MFGSQSNGGRTSNGYNIGEKEQWCLSTLGYVKAFSRQYASEVNKVSVTLVSFVTLWYFPEFPFCSFSSRFLGSQHHISLLMLLHALIFATLWYIFKG